MLLAVTATLLFARGGKQASASRFERRGCVSHARPPVWRQLRRRCLAAGGFIFYNTNVLNAYRTAADVVERRAESERRYARYQGVAQPQLAGMNLRVEIYPKATGGGDSRQLSARERQCHSDRRHSCRDHARQWRRTSQASITGDGCDRRSRFRPSRLQAGHTARAGREHPARFHAARPAAWLPQYWRRSVDLCQCHVFHE